LTALRLGPTIPRIEGSGPGRGVVGVPDLDIGVRPGDILAGKYQVERVLGVGGMGVVVAAHHVQLEEKVALKFLLPDALHNSEAVARFVREARAAVKIKSEHVARVTDVGQLENGSPYIVMEYLDGSDLSGLLRNQGAMPVEQAVDFVLQACEALADAHALGIVHRDLKPANLFCIQRSDGGLSIKVLDFGISKITTPGAPGHDMTRTSALMGSPLYMSPEQMTLSKGVDARTDIWSLGIILFELLTGRTPFEAEAVTHLAVKVTNDPAPPVRSIRFDAPAGLEAVIARCLEKDRAKRFQNVGELAVALRDFGPKNGRISVERVLGTLRKAGMFGDVVPPSGSAAAPVATHAASTPNAPQTDASWGHTAAGTRSGGKAVVGVAVAVALGVVVVAGVLVLRKPAASATSVAAPSAVATTMPSAVTIQPLATDDPTIAPLVEPAPRPAVAPPPPAANPSTKSSASSAPGPVQPAPPAPASATPAGPPSAAPARKPNCTPPYVVDSAGNHQYKPECL